MTNLYSIWKTHMVSIDYSYFNNYFNNSKDVEGNFWIYIPHLKTEDK